MALAVRQGVVAVCDMPNTKPAMTTEELVNRRFRTAEEEGTESGYYVYVEGHCRSKAVGGGI